MTRPADRLTGREPGERQPFSVRPFGMSAEEAAQVAASGPSSIPGTTGTNTGVNGTTGGAGEQATLTTGGFAASLRSGSGEVREQ